MSKQKYVRLKDYKEIIVFPDTIQHNEFKNWNPISAGFCYIEDNGTVKCFGESVSLDLKSLPEDSEILRKQLFDEKYY